MNKIYFITGASGSGKTTTIKAIQKEKMLDVVFCYFDSVGVPEPEEMIKQYGSGENWQKATTSFWIQKIKKNYLNKQSVILDGQMRLSFIKEACKQNNITNYEIILFDCTDAERRQRLFKRGNPELANTDMMNWARYLRQEAKKLKTKIIDSTNMTLEQTTKVFCDLIKTSQIIFRPAKIRDIKTILIVRKEAWLIAHPNKKFDITRTDIETMDFFSRKKVAAWRKSISASPRSKRVWVAEDKGVVVGFCVASKARSKNELDAIYILPKYQSKGIGRSLVEEAFGWLGTDKNILVSVAKYNKQAIWFYKKVGFKVKSGVPTTQFFPLPTGKRIPLIELVKRSE